MAVMHFVTQFTYVSIHPRVRRKQEKFFRENCFKIWCQIFGKESLCVHKSAFRKKFKNSKTKKNY